MAFQLLRLFYLYVSLSLFVFISLSRSNTHTHIQNPQSKKYYFYGFFSLFVYVFIKIIFRHEFIILWRRLTFIFCCRDKQACEKSLSLSLNYFFGVTLPLSSEAIVLHILAYFWLCSPHVVHCLYKYLFKKYNFFRVEISFCRVIQIARCIVRCIKRLS